MSNTVQFNKLVEFIRYKLWSIIGHQLNWNAESSKPLSQHLYRVTGSSSSQILNFNPLTVAIGEKKVIFTIQLKKIDMYTVKYISRLVPRMNKRFHWFVFIICTFITCAYRLFYIFVDTRIPYVYPSQTFHSNYTGVSFM